MPVLPQLEQSQRPSRMAMTEKGDRAGRSRASRPERRKTKVYADLQLDKVAVAGTVYPRPAGDDPPGSGPVPAGADGRVEAGDERERGKFAERLAGGGADAAVLHF